MKNCHTKIKVVAASVKGPLHQNENLPCQDYFKFCRSGKNFVAVVSDGAGSSLYGKIGARIVCETLIDLLKNAKPEKIRETVAQAIEIARSKVCRHRYNSSKSLEGIEQFAATVVGVVCFQKKGIFFHIGDGAALAFSGEKITDFVASRPENGNFSCETFFFTQPNWKHNLRFTSFENMENIFLMSDGLTTFAFSKNFEGLERGFILPIHRFLQAEKCEKKASVALANTLNNTKAQKLNKDDKTLLWAQFEKAE